MPTWQVKQVYEKKNYFFQKCFHRIQANYSTLRTNDLAKQMNNWTIKNSSDLYGLNLWGDDYCSINQAGNIEIHPKGKDNQGLDLLNLVKELEGRNLKLPLLLRFDDILEDRLNKVHLAFQQAITQYNYKGNYQGVFPVKCNHQRHVVDELIACGQKWNFGLEAGSKAELLIALALIDNPKAFLICNGYKDERYIETAILARQLGRQAVIVIEQIDEVDRIISSSRALAASPIIGIRAKLSSQSSGRWASTTGDNAKFGLSIPQILQTVEKLHSASLLNDLKMLHFHVGSQINDIAVLKDALQEAAQIYIELNRLGAPMGTLNVGGGLGVDYDGSRTATSASTNYSLQNYANDVVATIQESCQTHRVEMPTLISESGRAIASHFSVLLFNILGTNFISSTIPPYRENECLTIKNLRQTLNSINYIKTDIDIDISILQEAWNDAIKFKEDTLSAFRLGYLSLTERAIAEQLTWACAQSIVDRLPNNQIVPKELQSLKASLSGTYYANLSIFRSAPDTWAIDQVFPMMPIHKLNEEPKKLGKFADLTCDSDGQLSKFIGNGKSKTLLELHDFKKEEDYVIGLFLGGAYQEVMGNLHNLFGSTNSVHIRLNEEGGYQLDHVIRANTKSDVLSIMNHDPEQLLEKLRIASEDAIKRKTLKITDAQKLMDHIETSLRQSTYLHE